MILHVPKRSCSVPEFKKCVCVCVCVCVWNKIKGSKKKPKRKRKNVERLGKEDVITRRKEERKEAREGGTGAEGRTDLLMD